MRLTTATLAVCCTIAGAASAGDAVRNPMTDSATWDAHKVAMIGEVDISTATAPFELEAPYRAHDAATVPISITQTETDARIERLMLIIDENPAPVAAEFTFGPSMGRLDLETRVRVDQYSNIRAVATNTDGETYMAGRFVKASGGCSAPASKDAVAALAAMGEMKFRAFEPETPAPNRREAQIMIRHPNFTGLQRDQITHLFVNAHFIDELEVHQGDDLLFRMEAGISISENPTFRFSYDDNGSPALEVYAVDTEGNEFMQSFAKVPQSG